MADFSPRVNADNPDPRIACALLLDTSSSMSGGPIDMLNRGFELFCDEIKKDDLARKRAEITVITFGGVARVEIPFTEGRDLQPRRLTASGSTPMGAALDLALDQLAAQKQAYKQAGLEYYRPSTAAKAVTPASVVTCTTVTGLSHPGNTLYSYGYFVACTGGDVECSATVDMQEESVGSGSWSIVGYGPMEYGCPPYMGISTVTATCHSTPHAFNYRTRGIYVLSGGTVSTKVAYSPVTTLYDACTT